MIWSSPTSSSSINVSPTNIRTSSVPPRLAPTHGARRLPASAHVRTPCHAMRRRRRRPRLAHGAHGIFSRLMAVTIALRNRTSPSASKMTIDAHTIPPAPPLSCPRGSRRRQVNSPQPRPVARRQASTRSPAAGQHQPGGELVGWRPRQHAT